MQDERVIGQVEKTVFDCPDPRVLAAFYAEVLGMKMLEDEPDWVVIGRKEHMRELAFQRVDPYLAPRWPDEQHPQQLHLDIAHVQPGHPTRLWLRPDPAHVRESRSYDAPYWMPSRTIAAARTSTS